jgi:hypothetical protein
MVAADYLRHQANACLRIARGCFDLATAARLRLMAAELKAKADESDRGLTAVSGTNHNSDLFPDDTSHNGIKRG